MDKPYSIKIDPSESAGSELMPAIEQMVRELIRGVRHGFFKMSVKVEMMPTKKKCITVSAGKSYRFVI
jgi:hypothetical protein